MPPIAEKQLDEILAQQLTVAWAGEGACEPPRLGWWKTDLVDPAGGGDLFARLLPKTHAWASLEAVREAARRTDAEARARTPDPDGVRTLFFLGFELDERLDERLAFHKRSGVAPAAALPLRLELGAAFSKGELEAALRMAGTGAEHKVVAGGRQMKDAVPDDPAAAVGRLAAALLPFADKYPMPFYGAR